MVCIFLTLFSNFLLVQFLGVPAFLPHSFNSFCWFILGRVFAVAVITDFSLNLERHFSIYPLTEAESCFIGYLVLVTRRKDGNSWG